MGRKKKDSEVSNRVSGEKFDEDRCGGKSLGWTRKMRSSWSEICDSVEKTLEFQLTDLTSFEKFVRLMYRPVDSASLGVARALFGLCMVIDVVEERGFADIDIKWGDPNGCHFPLIHGMERPSLPTMILLYTVMWIGAFGIMLGFWFKFACACFAIPYWYIFLLDKSFWNNHSYLYGIVVILLWGTGANRYFSLDAKLSNEKDATIPQWNYFIVKFQFFALYFLAGLKKSSREWLEGYAMTNLSRHWVFDPFKNVLTSEQTDYFIVHWFGFIFDLTVGFWMIIPKTRIPAMIFCTVFHLMNSRLFSIGMFPYVCLVTMPLFCNNDWPRKTIAWFTESASHSSKCETYESCKNTEENALDLLSDKIGDFEKDEKKSEIMKKDSEFDTGMNIAQLTNDLDTTKGLKMKSCTSEEHVDLCENTHEKIKAWRYKIGDTKKLQRANKKQKFVVALLIFHVAMQFFLPYSHFITKGYNNWVPGLYGYSWDMMVHAWDVILVVIRVHDNTNNEDLFMNPQAWVQNDRWTKHGDMVRQHAHCLKNNLMRQRDKVLSSPRRTKDMEQWSRLSSNLSIYVDVWCSLNGRFQQRIFDPNVDMLTVDWHPFKPISYLMPLLTQFSSYRNKLDDIQNHVYSWSNYTDVFFVADYPGMQLENYISNDFSNVSVTVLEGTVSYTEEGSTRKTPIVKGDWTHVNTGVFHTIKTTSSYPACYMYTYTNQTEQQTNLNGGQKATKRKTPMLPILTELKYKFNAWVRVMGHIANAFLYLIYDVPMIRRVKNY